MRRLDHRRALVACGLLLAGVLAAAGRPLAQQREQSLDSAKARYGAAAYEEALAILDAVQPAEGDLESRADIQKYRALCLLALGRKADGERTMERLVALKPSLRGDQLEAAPWVREVFGVVRRRALPGVVGENYERAKAAVLQKAFQEATGRLKEVLLLLDDADLAGTDERWRRDLKTLAQGFLDLAGAGLSSSAAPAAAEAQRTLAVVPAVPVIEEMPRWPPELRGFVQGRDTATGVIEVTVNEKGEVDAAVMREPIHPVYDALLVAAARTTWRYRPATKGGAPVRDTRRVRVVVNLR